jgi:hypothetical protein
MRRGALVALGLILITALPALAVQRVVLVEDFANVG